MKHLLELAGFFLLSFPLAVLPRRVSAAAGRFLGAAAYYLWGNRRKIAVENIRGAKERNALADPRGPEALAKAFFINLGGWVSELVKVYYGLGDGIVGDIRVEGLEHFERARRTGKGVILVTGHCGNWELLSLAVSAKAGKACGVVRKQSNPYMDRFIIRARKRYGTDVVYKAGALRKFISMLKEGGTVGVLMDQAVVPSEGFLVDFLGAPAWTTKMPAALAKRTGAALVPVFQSRMPEGHVMRFYPEVELEGDEARDTERLSAYVEGFIREYPDQWLWIHRRWKRTGKPEK